ncbi:MAG: hypothetical protein JO297_15900 [Nitrososphaeraceae archaeon]|nr:hypothetical protein [Nitrososphaeraceae archaeon]
MNDDTSGEDIDLPKDEEYSTPSYPPKECDASGKDTIALDLGETLQNELIVTSFTVNK